MACSLTTNNNVGVSLTEDESKCTETENHPTTSSDKEQDLKIEENSENGPAPLSKNQLRKLKKKEKWLAIKDEKRKKERAKRKKRYADARLQGISLGPSRKALKLNAMKNSECRIRVVVDCSFDEFMSEKDVMKLVKQLQSCYSANRRAENPLQFYVCGINGQTKERLDMIGDSKNWDVHFTLEKYTEKFEKSEIVYLSSESDNVLTELEDDKVYVIGGLVDHNHHKGLCHRLAVENNISHAQLPISEYLEMKSRKVLTVNHVFEILLRFTESKDWRQSLCQVIPERKGITPLSSGTEGETSKNHTNSETIATEAKGQNSKNLKKLEDKISEKNLSHSESPESLRVESVKI